MEIRPILSALLRSRTGAILIAAQVALTLAIVSNALFVVNDRLALSARPSGVDESVVFHIDLSPTRDIDDVAAMQRLDVDTLRAVPGVVDAAWSNQVPMGMSGWGLGLSHKEEDESLVLAAAWASPDSLVNTLGLTLVEGRDFLPSEYHEFDMRRGAMHAESIIVTRRTATQLFPDETSVVGRSVFMRTPAGFLPVSIVGVVERLKSPFAQASDNAWSGYILPIRFLGQGTTYLVRVDRPDAMPAVQRDAEAALLGLRRDRVLANNRTLSQVRDVRYAPQRSVAGMLIAVTIGLLLITGSGVVGMASLWVAQRRKQIGTRRALGATRAAILRYFLTENALITSAGIVLGLILGIVLNNVLVGQIEMPRLPLTYLAGSAAVLWLLGLVAVLGPAWRAAAVPPAVATRAA
ncbi:MAG TPA: FtsX-like permease family protein [Xanthomonadaceae bacterium]|nr:FtsX-like permease family protein [Xanthomonadaceae bacterium]